MRFRTTAFDDPAVVTLATAQQDELRARYGGDAEPGTKPSKDDILLAVVLEAGDGTPIACGALRALDATTVELKRMYVLPAHRGQGLSRLLLARLEDEARTHGFTTARLETGILQPEAINLYVSSGYHEIPLYGEYAGVETSRCFGRVL